MDNNWIILQMGKELSGSRGKKSCMSWGIEVSPIDIICWGDISSALIRLKRNCFVFFSFKPTSKYELTQFQGYIDRVTTRKMVTDWKLNLCWVVCILNLCND